MSLDRELFLLVQDLTGNGLIDSLMVLLAEYLIVLVPLSLAYLWFKDSEKSFFSFYTAVLGVIAAYGLGLLYTHQNPSTVFETIVAANPEENAFPSQHTAAILAISLPMLYRKKRVIGSILLGSGLLTGFARVYIGEHWPIDILGAFGAALIALIIGITTWKLLEPLWRPIIEFAQSIEGKIFEKMPVNSPRHYIRDSNQK